MARIIKKIVGKLFFFFGIQLSRVPKLHRHEGIITGRVGKFDLLMTVDHNIVSTIARYPSYCANLPRIVRHTQKKYRDMRLVDVGANIGDGVALVRTETDCYIICIEGDSEYFALLETNLQQFKDVTALNYFLGEKVAAIAVEAVKRDGTLRIQDSSAEYKDAKIRSLEITTLDTLARKYQELLSLTKVLKIDTDGYDLKIIRGSLEFLRRNTPVLFFEYDRVYLDAIGDDGLSALEALTELNYSRIMFYDAYGRFIMATRLENIEEIRQLDAYIAKKKGACLYYDVCIFHRNDEDIALSLVETELTINKN